MDNKKEKLSFIQRQFQRFINKKKEITETASQKIKQFTHDNSSGLRKLFAGAVMLSSFGLGAQAKPDNPLPHKDDDIKRKLEFKQDTPIKTDIFDSTFVADIATLNATDIMNGIKTEGIYNGHHLNLKTARPETIVHLFEASGKQTILDGKNIENSRYIGDFQFNLSNTIYELAKYCRADFPELAKAAGVDVNSGRILKKNARSQEFCDVWCKLCNGSQSKKFAKMRFEFMFKTHFKPTFDKLHQEHADFPHITIDNYANSENFLFSVMVMGTATQSPGSAFKIISKQIKEAKEDAKKKGEAVVTPLEIFNRVANRKIKLWGFAKRYNAEKKIAADMSAYFAANAKLYALQHAKPEQETKTVIASTATAQETYRASQTRENPKVSKNESTLQRGKISIGKKRKKNNVVIASRGNNALIEDKLRRFAGAPVSHDVVAVPVQKELPPTETPMIEKSEEIMPKMTTNAASNNKKEKLKKLIETKKKEVRLKIATTKKKKSIKFNTSSLYAIKSRTGASHS